MEGYNVNSILKLIRENRDQSGFISLRNAEVARRLGDDLDKNANLYRMVAIDGNVRAIRMAGGGDLTTDFHHEEANQPSMSEEFLVPRDDFRRWYCEYVVKYPPKDATTMEDIQSFQKQFDDTKGGVVVSVDHTLEYLMVCLTEELGEVARCVKKMRRCEANGDEQGAGRWLNEMNDEMADLFIYLVILANKKGVRLGDLYFQKMAKNQAELDKGGGKFLGTAAPEHNPVQITRN